MNYDYGRQEMDTAQDLVVRAGRKADPSIHDDYDYIVYYIRACGTRAITSCACAYNDIFPSELF